MMNLWIVLRFDDGCQCVLHIFMHVSHRERTTASPAGTMAVWRTVGRGTLSHQRACGSIVRKIVEDCQGSEEYAHHLGNERKAVFPLLLCLPYQRVI